MEVTRLEINQWQQFEKVDIELHNRLTILTGANGSGKTTILNLFAKHAGWSNASLSTPKREKGTGVVKFFTRLFNGIDKSADISIGKFTYSNQINADLTIANSTSAQYQIQIKNQQSVPSFYIPSHRAVFRYQVLGNIPTSKKNKRTAFQEVSSASRRRYSGNTGGSSASFAIKSTLIAWAINGYGVKNNDKIIMPPDIEQINNFEGFQIVLKKLLPKTLGFEEIEIRNMEIVFICNGGQNEFLLETASGGISALIDIAWQIYMYSTNDVSCFTVIIDEVENHLHPKMQRTILKNLVDAFPSAKFIVSTHSPLVVSSVKDSSIYALSYRNNKIISQKLDLLKEAKTATEILDEVLGVSFTMPIWVEDKLIEIIEKYTNKDLSKEGFVNLRSELKSIGLEKMMPYAIQRVMENVSD